jgi:hypothetical protein
MNYFVALLIFMATVFVSLGAALKAYDWTVHPPTTGDFKRELQKRHIGLDQS